MGTSWVAGTDSGVEMSELGTSSRGTSELCSEGEKEAKADVLHGLCNSPKGEA